MTKRGAAAEDMRGHKDTEGEEEVTEKRRKSEVQAFAPCMIPTKWIRAVKPELLAIARGDVDTEPPPPPSDPYGGLIPVLDEDEHVEAIDEDWYLLEGGARADSVPRLVLRHDELIGLPIDHRHGFLLCQIDGVRTVADLCDLCSLQAADAITMVDELVALGALMIE